jgi:hypothetical protein
MLLYSILRLRRFLLNVFPVDPSTGSLAILGVMNSTAQGT